MKKVEFESFEAFHASNVPGKCEIVTIVNDKRSDGHKTVSAYLLTECKSYQTALRRFFKALEGDSRFEGWQADIEDFCEHGYFNDGNCWHVVEDYDGGRFYVELTVNA